VLTATRSFSSGVVTFVVIAVGILLVSGSDAYPFQRGLSSVSLNINGHNLSAEVASTPDQWHRGLSFRKRNVHSNAMLFVFLPPRLTAFSARNLFYPLSVAFVNSKGLILEIKHLERRTSSYVSYDTKVQYVLEVPEDWFSKRGISKGDYISMPPYIINLQPIL